MSGDYTVLCRDVEFTYRLSKSGSSRRFKWQSSAHDVNALRGISFYARKGESVGVLGKNGSGKSTLMAILSGEISPTRGDIYTSARPTLISVGAALQGHLTGNQNAKLGLFARGVAPAEVAEKIHEIRAWSELGDAMDRPFKTFSSGMKARLKFAIATAVTTEILLIDEALSTGDSAFTIKARERMNKYLEGSGTVFLVSHSATTIRKHCTRAIWLDEGEIIADGDLEGVSRTYERWSKSRAKKDESLSEEIILETKASYNKPLMLFDSEASELLSSDAIGKAEPRLSADNIV